MTRHPGYPGPPDGDDRYQAYGDEYGDRRAMPAPFGHRGAPRPPSYEHADGHPYDHHIDRHGDRGYHYGEPAPRHRDTSGRDASGYGPPPEYEYGPSPGYDGPHHGFDGPPPGHDHRARHRYDQGPPRPGHGFDAPAPPPGYDQEPPHRDVTGPSGPPGYGAPTRSYDPDSTAQIPTVPDASSDSPARFPKPPYADADPTYGPPHHGHPEGAYQGRDSGSDRGRPPGRSKVGLLLGVVGGVLALVLIGGATVFLLSEGSPAAGGAPSASSSMHPDFADPGKVVDKWLKAMFVGKDAKTMLRYTCKKEADRGEADDVIASVKKAEKDAEDAKLTMKVTWSKPKTITTDGAKAKVTSTLKVVVGDETQRKPTNFDLVNEAGWKVCDAEMP